MIIFWNKKKSENEYIIQNFLIFWLSFFQKRSCLSLFFGFLFFLVLNQIQFEMKKINYRPTSSMWISKLDLIFFKFTFFLKPRVTIGKITEINFQTFLFRESKSETNKIWSLSKNNIKIKFGLFRTLESGLLLIFFVLRLYFDQFDNFISLIIWSINQLINLITWSFDHLINLTIWSVWSFDQFDNLIIDHLII